MSMYLNTQVESCVCLREKMSFHANNVQCKHLTVKLEILSSLKTFAIHISRKSY